MIEQLQADKTELVEQLEARDVQATKAIKIKDLAEEEAARLKLMIDAAELNKRMLQTEVQNLTGIVEFLKHTTIQSMDDFLNKLKLDLSLLAAGPQASSVNRDGSN